MLPLLVLLGTIAGAWYLLIVRPQKDQQTRHGRLVERLQVGDHVLTVGGIYGRVAAVEGSSVVLELAPGLTTRIATDGIARIVHGAEAALPTTASIQASNAPPQITPNDALDTDMHQQPHPDQQPQHAPQFAAPAYVAPQQPYATPPTQLAAPPAPAATPSVRPVAGETTLRAHVVGSSIPTFEPRPWTDVAPSNARTTAVQAPAPVPHPYPQQHAPQPMPVQQPYAPQPMPLHAPFAAPTAPAGHPMPQHAPGPAMHAPVQPVAFAPQPTYAPAPTHAPQLTYASAPVHPTYVAPAPDAVHAPQAVAADAGPTRRHSRAPQGMGSTLRLDDPSLRDAMTRARDERSGLADEYRKLTAPLVDVGTTQVVDHGAAPATDAVFVGHDPNGVPLFAAPGAPVAHPMTQYPAPARVAGASAVPRPVVHAPQGVTVDPALTSTAFQRRTPYAPDPAFGVPATANDAVPATPSLAHAT